MIISALSTDPSYNKFSSVCATRSALCDWPTERRPRHARPDTAPATTVRGRPRRALGHGSQIRVFDDAPASVILLSWFRFGSRWFSAFGDNNGTAQLFAEISYVRIHLRYCYNVIYAATLTSDYDHLLWFIISGVSALRFTLNQLLHARPYARTHARTHARTRVRKYTRTHTH